MFGSNEKGKLGINSWEEIINEPMLIEAFLKRKIQNVSFGYQHTLILTEESKLYGCGEGTSLGINTKKDQYLPI